MQTGKAVIAIFSIAISALLLHELGALLGKLVRRLVKWGKSLKS